jgi:16S rRNA (cytosine967-C5)-methyltransferase
VELAKQRGFGPQAGFVNALLRGYLREFDPTKRLLADLRARRPWLGYSHPEWLATRWQTRWGQEAAAQLMAWNNTPPKTFARVNTLKVEAGKLLEQWREENVEYDFVRRDWLEENLIFDLKSYPPLAKLPSFQQGLFYVQDPSTLLAVRELAPRPGEAVLDLCAAPGGKLTCIAQLMHNEGRLVAYDTSPERLRLVEENCARLGVRVSSPLSVVSSKDSPKSAHFGPRTTDHARTTDYALLTTDYRLLTTDSGPLTTFDKILIDAPCSNTGVMRRRVDLRWRIRPEEIERLRVTQLELLRKSASLLKPGGLLVYSTCSLEPEENEQVAQEFLSSASAFKQEAERQLLPFADSADGAYVTRLRRQA